MEGIVSLLNLSTSASFLLIIGQYQLLTILPLVGSYMPSDISDYWTGLKVWLFSINVADPKSLLGISLAYSYMDEKQSNSYLTDINILSESTFVNTFSLQLTLALLLVIHLTILVMYLILRPFREVETNIFRKIVKLLFSLFTFDVYIMLTISWFLFVTLSALLETYSLVTCEVSIAISFVMLILLTLFLVLWLHNWYITRSSEDIRQHSYWRKLYPELKDKRKAGLYIFVELSRIVGLIVCISYLKSVLFIARCALYSVCQTVFLVLIVWQRPFRKVIANLMKILNKINYFVLWTTLNFLETKDKWSTTIEKSYLYLMM